MGKYLPIRSCFPPYLFAERIDSDSNKVHVGHVRIVLFHDAIELASGR